MTLHHTDLTEEDTAQFVSACIPTVWALETLLLLKRIAPGAKDLGQIVSHLRSSESAISQGLSRLEQVDLITQRDGEFRYMPASELLARLSDEIERLYTAKPLWLMNMILKAKNENLQVFANSFRLKK